MEEKEEMLDLIDDNDNVIGKEKRSIIQEKNILRRISEVFIFNSEGKLLVQKRSGNKKRSPNLFASSAAGHVTTGEDYLATAHRELKEEIGIDVPLEFVARFRLKNSTTNQMGQLFKGIFDGPFRVNEEEVDSVAFFDLHSLDIAIRNNPSLFTYGFKEIYKIYLEYETQ
jgi:isopentenyldiphosphate isomerase